MGPLLLLALHLSVAAPSCVVGTVRDARSGEPIAGAIVGSDDPRHATGTGPDGAYALAAPSGSLRLTVRMIGYATRSLEVFVPRDGVRVDVALEPDPIPLGPHWVHASVAVRGLDGIRAPSLVDTEMRIESVRNHPLSAEPDGLQALGGGDVALEPETPSGVHVRGGAADQTVYLLDGVPIFSPYHAGGLFSAWNPDALSSLRLSSTAPPLASPQALAGAVEGVTLAPGSAFGARGSASTTQTRVTLDGPIGGTKAGYVLSLRSGYPGLLAPREESTYLQGETGDYLGKLEGSVARGRLRLLAYDSENENDAASVVAPEGAPAAPIPPRHLFWWRARSLGAGWERELASATVRVQAWSALGAAGSAWGVGDDRQNMTSDRRDEGLLVRAARGESDLVGVRLERTRTLYRVVADTLGAAPWELSARTPILTLFAQRSRRLGERASVELGGSLAAAAGHLYAAPRAQALWRPSAKLALHATYARTHQFLQSLRNPESVAGGIFPADLCVAAGAGGVPVATGDLGVVAAEARPTSATRLLVQAYGRAARGLLLVAPRAGGPFATGTFCDGSGTVGGAAIDFALRTRHCGLVSSYGWQTVRLAYGDSSYAPGFAARHAFEAGVIYFAGSTFSARLGVSGAMGRQAAAVAGGFEWEAHNLLDRGSEFAGTPSYDGGTLAPHPAPGYFRVDVGVRKEWRIRWGGRQPTLALFGSATNVLGRKNVLTYARDASTGDLVPVEMRPRAPLVAGLDWRF